MIAGAGNWRSKSIASRGWWPSCSSTKTVLQDIAKKVVTTDQQRAAADYLRERYGVSQRRICRVMGRSRSGLRYRRKHRSDEPALNREIKRLARRHPRYGQRLNEPRLSGPKGLDGQPQAASGGSGTPWGCDVP